MNPKASGARDRQPIRSTSATDTYLDLHVDDISRHLQLSNVSRVSGEVRCMRWLWALCLDFLPDFFEFGFYSGNILFQYVHMLPYSIHILPMFLVIDPDQ